MVPQVLCKADETQRETECKEEMEMETANRYALILAVVNRGSLDTVMDAAREAGAAGGTAIHAKGTGTELVQKLSLIHI